MLKMLNKFLNTKKYIAVYVNKSDSTKFLVGTVSAVDNGFFALNQISPRGTYDGTQIMQINDILRIETDSRYCKELLKIAADPPIYYPLRVDNENVLVSAVHSAIVSQKIVTVAHNENLITGFIASSHDGLCNIKCVDPYGYNDGTACIMIDEITQISFDTEDEQILFELWKVNNNTALSSTESSTKNGINDILLYYAAKQQYISVYTNSGNGHFIYGRILASDETFTAISTVLPNGNSDGIVCILTNNINRIDTDTQYDNEMKKLISKKPIPEINFDNHDICCSILTHAKETQQMVSIELINSGINDTSGLVVGITDGVCCIKQIDVNGSFDGFTYIDIEDITQIALNTEAEQRIFRLYNTSADTLKEVNL